MKKIIISLILAAVMLPMHAFAANNPKANEKAVVVAGNARFTVLTPQMIRM
jgi:alpha-glucosidase